MKIDAVPGITTDYRGDAEEPGGDRYHASSAPSSAGWATPSCARPCTSSPPADFDGLGAAHDRPRGRAPAAAAARPRGAAVDGKQLFTAGNAADRRHRLRQLPHAGRRGHQAARSGRTSTRSLKGKDAAFIKESIVEPDKEIAHGLRRQHHAPELRADAVGGGARRARDVHRQERARRRPANGSEASCPGLVPGDPASSRSASAFSFALLCGAALGVRRDPRLRRRGRPAGRAADGPDVVPGRHRLLRLLGPLGARQARRRRPQGPRRALLEGLLQGQHRSQGDRRPVRLPVVLLHVHRRPARDARARGARRAGPPVRRREHLQRPLLGATRRS